MQQNLNLIGSLQCNILLISLYSHSFQVLVPMCLIILTFLDSPILSTNHGIKAQGDVCRSSLP